MEIHINRDHVVDRVCRHFQVCTRHVHFNAGRACRLPANVEPQIEAVGDNTACFMQIFKEAYRCVRGIIEVASKITTNCASTHNMTKRLVNASERFRRKVCKVILNCDIATRKCNTVSSVITHIVTTSRPSNFAEIINNPKLSYLLSHVVRRRGNTASNTSKCCFTRGGNVQACHFANFLTLTCPSNLCNTFNIEVDRGRAHGAVRNLINCNTIGAGRISRASFFGSTKNKEQIECTKSNFVRISKVKRVGLQACCVVSKIRGGCIVIVRCTHCCPKSAFNSIVAISASVRTTRASTVASTTNCRTHICGEAPLCGGKRVVKHDSTTLGVSTSIGSFTQSHLCGVCALAERKPIQHRYFKKCSVGSCAIIAPLHKDLSVSTKEKCHLFLLFLEKSRSYFLVSDLRCDLSHTKRFQNALICINRQNSCLCGRLRCSSRIIVCQRIIIF